MKNIKIKFYFLAILLLLGMNACQDELELEPAQSVSEDLALNSDQNVKAVLIGAYDRLGSGDVFGGNTLRNSELLAGDGELRWVGTFSGPRELFNKVITVGNGDVSEVWLDAYEAINIVNNVLSALSVVNEDDRAAVEGEALFIRSILYFELVRFFAKPYEAGQANDQPGVPIILTPTRGINEANQIARSTIKQVYDQIIGDLVKAETQLPADNEWRANKWAAAGLLARVYLQQGNYANARDAASRVIASGDFRLVTKYADVFGRDENSSEDIFAIQVTTQDGVNNMTTFFSIQDFGGRDGDIEILPGHLNLYNSADERLAVFFEANGGVTYSGKWNNQFGNISIIRLAEMYLVRAEANARLNTAVGAAPLADYNQVHTRAGLPAATAVTVQDILLERRLELAHEGFRLHDVKRTKGTVGSFAYNSDKLVFPIPLREIIANPKLTQNTGY